MLDPRRALPPALFVMVIALLWAGGARSSAAQAITPLIESVEPTSTHQWSYVQVTGTNLQDEEGMCAVKIGGESAYVTECSATRIKAVVPWDAGSSGVEVSRDGILSNTKPLDVSPVTRLEDLPSSGGIVEGRIRVKLSPSAEVGTVKSLVGGAGWPSGPIGQTERLKYSYDVAVPAGKEFEEARNYQSFNDIVYAAPLPLPVRSAAPDDTLYASGAQWGLAKIDAEGAGGHADSDGVAALLADAVGAKVASTVWCVSRLDV